MATALEPKSIEITSAYRGPAVISRKSIYGPVSMLPDRRPPWKEFLFSIGTQGIVVALLLWVGVLHPNVLVPIAQKYRGVELVSTPHPVDQNPAPVRPIKIADEIKAPLEVLKVAPLLPRVPKPLPKDDPPSVPKNETANLPFQPTATVIPKEAVKTNVFSSGSSQTPTIDEKPSEVQTGGFGDPRGAAAQDNKNRPVTIAQQGAFDLPSGAGHGNGTAGAQGIRGVVASSGFGDGTATSDSSKGNFSTNDIHEGAFGDVQSAAPDRNSSKHAEVAARIKPAEILSKPVPAYTEEARKLHIEGEVLLEVVFESSGSVRVVRVVHGLGHGLDESAMRAAEGIRFTPAQRDGQPVDFTGVLHILFQLA